MQRRVISISIFVSAIASLLCAQYAISPQPAQAEGFLRRAVREGIARRVNRKASNNTAQATSDTASKNSRFETATIAGLKVAIWKPENMSGPNPMVIFSHGFRGSNMQSEFIMTALADAGYLVFACNHKDAMGSGNFSGKSEAPFKDGSKWSDETYKDRGEDISRLIQALKQDAKWKSAIDWSKVALMGHSLGGYTSLALAGAWPSWKLDDIKAAVALSPYLAPFLKKGNLSGMNVPVMYQGGTADFGVTPFLKSPHGAFNSTSSPAYFVELTGANHFTWTNLNKQESRAKLINYYCVNFLDKYVKGDPKAHPEQKLPGVSTLSVK